MASHSESQTKTQTSERYLKNKQVDSRHHGNVIKTDGVVIVILSKQEHRTVAYLIFSSEL